MAGESTTASPVGAPLAGVAPVIIAEPRSATVVAPLAHWHNGGGQSSVAQARITTAPTVTSITTGAAEGDAQSYTEVVTTASTYTPAMKVVLILLSTQAARSTPSDLKAAMKEAANRAIAAQVDTDLCNLASSLPAAGGATGNPLTVATIQTAAAFVRATAKNAGNALALVLSSKQFGDAEGDALSSQSPLFVQAGKLQVFNAMSPSQEVASPGTLFGMQVFVTDNVQTSGADRIAMIIRPAVAGEESMGAALGGAMDFISEPKEFDQLGNARAATSVALDARYGVGIEDPTKGGKITSVA